MSSSSMVTAGAALRKTVRAQRRWRRASLGVGVGIVAIAIAASIVAILYTPYSPTRLNLAHRLQAPSFSHLLGTDEFGRDIFSRVLVALRLDLLAIFIVTYVPLVIGMAIGMIAGYYRGKVDAVLMRLVDGVIAFPFIVFILAVVAATGPGIQGYYIGVLAVGWAPYARLTRGEMLVLREREFIQAAQALAYSTKRILLRHAAPNLLRPNLVFSASDLVLNLVLLAGLSYLGLGIQPPQPELGALVAQGQDVLLQAWWVTTLPGVVIVILGAGFSMIGDGIGDWLIPGFERGV